MKKRAKIAFIILIAFNPPLLAGASISLITRGLPKYIRAQVRSNTGIERERRSKTLNASRIQNLYKDAPDEIREALESFGYYNASIESSIRQKRNRYIAEFSIETGKPTLISEIDFAIIGEGAEEPFFKGYALPFGNGDKFVHGDYELAKTNLLRISREHGYFDAAFTTHTVMVDSDANTCEINLVLETMRRYYLGGISIEHDALDASYVERLIHIKPGMPYSSDELLLLRQNLNNSGHFETIDVTLNHDKAEYNIIPVEIRLGVLKRYRAIAGAGYGTDTGPRGSVGWENRRVNERGHRFRSLFMASSIRTAASGLYEIPMKNPLTDTLSFQAGWKRETTDVRESTSLSFTPQFRRNIGKEWVGSVFVEFLDEFFEVGNTKDHTRLIIPGVSISRTLANNLIYPEHGSSIIFEYKATDPAIGSNIGFSKLSAKGKIIRTPLWENRLLLRGEAGYIDSASFDRLPASLRYFTGGDSSVRGYAYESLAPRDNTGEIIGGQNLLVGSAEYEYKITERWRGAFFYDAGNAFNHIKNNIYKAWGVGIRWRSPVGPIRFDIAFPISDAKKDFRIHINMEPDL